MFSELYKHIYIKYAIFLNLNLGFILSEQVSGYKTEKKETANIKNEKKNK